MISDIEGIVWPPIRVGQAAALSALLHELDRSQWLSRAEIKAHQAAQLRSLISHHAKHTPWFAARLAAQGLSASDIHDTDSLRKLLPFTRADWQAAGEQLYAGWIPEQHMPINQLKTSGSTGEPVTIRKTLINGLDWSAHTVRDHVWNRRDLKLRMMSIRADIKAVAHVPNWGYPVAMLYETGPGLGVPITTDIRQQITLAREFDPDILVVYPSNLSALLEIWERDGYDLNIRHVKTLGETVSNDLRQRVIQTMGIEIEDAYSSNEVGTLALSPDDCEQYHAMDETLIVEVLDEQGNPCAEMQTGRVVVTDLRNFATPIIRYSIGDYATVGTACSCGRGLTALHRIMGRQRNLVAKPDGSRHWPLTGFYGFRDVADIKQYQLIQHSLEQVELRLFVEQQLTAEQHSKLEAMVQQGLGHAFTVIITESRTRLPVGANGKFEEFVCKV